MKKKYLLGILMGLVVMSVALSRIVPVQASSGNVKIDSVRFPDGNFREVLKSKEYDKNQDGVLSAKEIKSITHLDINTGSIHSLEGIEFLINLTELNCSKNDISKLNLSKNVKLERLDCACNNLSKLDVSKNVNLNLLVCSESNLSKLDVSKNKNLEELYCYKNNLTKLDLSKNSKLKYIQCYDNNLNELDVSKNKNLERIDCSVNNLSKLDVSKNVELEYLMCGSNKLSKLDVSKNKKLSSLHCYGNKLSKLDISKNLNLKWLGCSENDLSKLDVSKNKELRELLCSRNKLSKLDVNKNKELSYLYCNKNKLNELDVSKNVKLRWLDCSENNLSKLDVSKNTELCNLVCHNNNLLGLVFGKNGEYTSVSCTFNKLVCLNLKSGHYEELQIGDNSRYVSVNSSNQFDLSKLEGFDVKKTSNWKGGKIDGNILTFTSDRVTYTYNTGGYNSNNEKIKVKFSLMKCTHEENLVKKTVKATFEKNGGVKTICTDCGKTIKTNTVYYRMEAPSLSKTSYTYNGDLRTPSVTIKDCKGTVLKKDTDYTVSYESGRRNPGKYKVTVKGKGKYSGTITKTFNIKPPKAAITSISSPEEKELYFKWKEIDVASGYQIYISLSDGFDKNTSKVNVKDNKTIKGSIKKLKSGKKYYVKIRAYKTVSDGKIYGSWSKVKSIKIK